MILQDPFSSPDPRQSVRAGLRELGKLRPNGQTVETVEAIVRGPRSEYTRELIGNVPLLDRAAPPLAECWDAGEQRPSASTQC